VTDKLNVALRAALKDPDFIKREEALGAVIVSNARLSGAEHKKFVGSPRGFDQDRNVIGMVTGPSLTSPTCMSAPNSPQATRGCSERAVATTRS